MKRNHLPAFKYLLSFIAFGPQTPYCSENRVAHCDNCSGVTSWPGVTLKISDEKFTEVDMTEEGISCGKKGGCYAR